MTQAGPDGSALTEARGNRLTRTGAKSYSRARPISAEPKHDSARLGDA